MPDIEEVKEEFNRLDGNDKRWIFVSLFVAVAGVLRAVVGAEHLPLEDALRVERDAVRRCSSSADQIEGMTAFLEKRRPRFEGK